MTDPIRCRVCGSTLDGPMLDLAAPALTSNNRNIDVPTRIYVCASCGHVQSPALPNLLAFYDTNYKISLDSEEHDQLYDMREGAPIYRTDRQAEVVLDKAALRSGARVLDYGAAKAQTLRKILARRPDLSPHVFDVSEDYRPFWSSWLAVESTASYAVPPSWQGRFDLVTTHYVLEHIPDPVGTLRTLSKLLAPGGKIFFSVPDWTQNSGDLLVADHMNHFTHASILRLAMEAGLGVIDFDAGALPAAFVVVCEAMPPGSHASKCDVSAVIEQARSIALAWNGACHRIDLAFKAHAGRGAAVYGAGFYGAFLLSRMAGRTKIACCLDNNANLWGQTLFDVPITAPNQLPEDVEVVYVGLNPARARAIVATIPALARAGLELTFIEI